MKITLIDLKNKLEQDFGWENLMSDNDNKWFVENLLKDTIQAIEVMSCCVNKPSKETQVIEVKQKDRKEAFKIEVEQLGSYRCPSWERCKNICEECAFVNGISTT
jgi:hypothetical protein